MYSIRRFVILFVCVFVVGHSEVGSAGLQEKLTSHTLKATPETRAIDVDLNQFQWLLGEWSGKGFGGQCFESWSPPAGGSMIGTFRHLNDSGLNFCEVFLLTKTDQGVLLKLKHFDARLAGWEEKDESVTFPLLKVKSGVAYFGGLTYELQDDGSLKAYLAMKQKDGTFREAVIHFQPASQKIQTP